MKTDHINDLKQAISDYHRMEQMLQTASPSMAWHIRETMDSQRACIYALIDEIEDEIKEATHGFARTV